MHRAVTAVVPLVVTIFVILPELVSLDYCQYKYIDRIHLKYTNIRLFLTVWEIYIIYNYLLFVNIFSDVVVFQNFCTAPLTCYW